MSEPQKHAVVIDPEGNPGLVPLENLDKARAEGFIDAPPDVTAAYQVKLREEQKREKYGSFAAGRAAEFLGGVRGLAASAFIPFDTVATNVAGVFGDEAKRSTKEVLSDLKEYRPVESTVGEIGGMVIPSALGDEVGIAKLGSKASAAVDALGGAGSSVASQIAKRAVQGAARGAAEGAALSAVSAANDQSLSDGSVSVEKFLADTGLGLGVGGAAGLFLGGLGAAGGMALGKARQAASKGMGKVSEALGRQANERLLDEIQPESKFLKGIIDSEGPEAIPSYAQEILSTAREAGVDLKRLNPSQVYRVSGELEAKAQASLARFGEDAALESGIPPLDEATREILARPNGRPFDELATAFDKAATRSEKVASVLEDDALKANAEKLRQRVTALTVWNESMVRDIARISSGKSSPLDSVFNLPSKVGSAIGGGLGGLVAGGGGALAGGFAGGAVGRVIGNILDNQRPHFISGLLDQAAVWSKMKASTLAMDAKVAKGLADFMAKTAPMSAKSAPSLFKVGSESRDKRVKSHADMIEHLTTDPKAMLEHTSRVTAQLSMAPEAQPAVSSKVASNILALRSRLPKNRLPQVGPFADLNDARYADNEVASYERYLSTVADPMEAVRAMRRGNLTKDHVDALRDTAPEVYASFQKSLIAHAVTESPGMQQREVLYQLFGVPMTPAQDPAFVNAVQAAYMADANKRQEGSQGGGSQKKPGSISKTSQSQTDRLDSPK